MEVWCSLRMFGGVVYKKVWWSLRRFGGLSAGGVVLLKEVWCGGLH